MIVRVLDAALLGLLMERDHHGYELRAQLRDRLGMWGNASFGSIYPALARFERLGWVEVRTEGGERLSGPSTGSLSGERAALRSRRGTATRTRRARKVYAITPAGREAFVRLLADPTTIDDSRSFYLKMAMARHLTPVVRVSLLERRRASLEDRLRELRLHRDAEALDDYARAVMDHGAQALELEIAWIDTLRQLDAPTPAQLTDTH